MQLTQFCCVRLTLCEGNYLYVPWVIVLLCSLYPCYIPTICSCCCLCVLVKYKYMHFCAYTRTHVLMYAVISRVSEEITTVIIIEYGRQKREVSADR